MIHENDFNRTAQAYFNDLKSSRYQPLKKEEERRLLERAKNGDNDAKNRILEANLRFVFDFAKKYKDKGVPLTELIAEGNMGLIKAIEKFDTNRDVKFITYAVWWVKNYMCDIIERHKNEIVVEYNTIMSSTITGNTSLYDEENASPEDSIEESDDNVYEEYGGDNSLILDKLISKIDDKEKNVILSYFGMYDNHPKTLQEIATEMNISSERVRQIKVIALRKMKSMALALSMS